MRFRLLRSARTEGSTRRLFHPRCARFVRLCVRTRSQYPAGKIGDLNAIRFKPNIFIAKIRLVDNVLGCLKVGNLEGPALNDTALRVALCATDGSDDEDWRRTPPKYPASILLIFPFSYVNSIACSCWAKS
jgi:hypothetical protein